MCGSKTARNSVFIRKLSPIGTLHSKMKFLVVLIHMLVGGSVVVSLPFEVDGFATSSTRSHKVTTFIWKKKKMKSHKKKDH